jgi:hypothetical protein
LTDQDFLKNLYNAVTAFNTYPGRDLIDLVVPTVINTDDTKSYSSFSVTIKLRLRRQHRFPVDPPIVDVLTNDPLTIDPSSPLSYQLKRYANVQCHSIIVNINELVSMSSQRIPFLPLQLPAITAHCCYHHLR